MILKNMTQNAGLFVEQKNTRINYEISNLRQTRGKTQNG